MTAQISQFSNCTQRKMIKSFSEQIGGYLEPSLSTPRLTRASAALTCSRTAFTQ
jgi:hypothetical protein